MSMDRITVTLLGKVAVERDGQPVPVLTGVLVRAVLMVLVVSGRPVARPELRALFWPEAPETQARQNARRVVARLRRALPGRIAADRHAVAFVAAAGDVIVPAAPGARPRDPADSRRARDTAAAGGAELAADLDSAAGAAFDAWLAARRAERRAAAAGSPTAIADAPLEGLAGGSGASLAERVARAVRAVDGVDVPPADLGRWLAPLERLVVLDDCDAVAGDAATAASLADWLEAAPDLTVLALASRPLGLVFEHRFVGTRS